MLKEIPAENVNIRPFRLIKPIHIVQVVMKSIHCSFSFNKR